jgi:type I restriction enzyme S subunit
VTRDRINLSILASIEVPVPTPEEQQAVVGSLDEIDAKLKALETKVAASVACIAEFRSALITAAVTGQIDVATWAKRGTSDDRLEEIEAAFAGAHAERQAVPA